MPWKMDSTALSIAAEHSRASSMFVQIHLVPSAGMSIKSESVVSAPEGYVFNCDGGGAGYHAYIAQVQKTADPATGYLGLKYLASANSKGSQGFIQSFNVHGGTSGMSIADFNKCFLPGNLPMIHITTALKIPQPLAVTSSKEIENPQLGAGQGRDCMPRMQD